MDARVPTDRRPADPRPAGGIGGWLAIAVPLLLVAALFCLVIGIILSAVAVVVVSVVVSALAVVLIGLAAARLRQDRRDDTGTVRATAATATADADDIDDIESDDEPADGDGEPDDGGGEPDDEPAAAAQETVRARPGDVWVIDGRPRYHRGTCSFIQGKDAEPISLAQALDDGFSPCSLCTPPQSVGAS